MATIDQIEEYVRKREFTDYIMPLWLPFLPLIIVLSSFFWFMIILYLHDQSLNGYRVELSGREDAVIYSALPIYVILVILATAINVYVVYKWVWRRNEHFKRQKLLFNSIKDFLKSKGFDVARLESICMEIDVEENVKNAVLWALIQFVPYIGGFLLIYVYHFLNKDFYRHERREDHFLGALSSILARRGFDFSYTRYNPIPDRSTILYFVLSLITFGLFGLYWVYTLTKDPNEHFIEHRRWEDQLLNVLRRL
ncbi:DUF4234 domain-containing protein [Archaeoglobus profundus]|uniref:DUF4234 domain-containing protein n=1 Tax=Archaeoglobus profundus (strain DSM 5631 / JCM 9629 / NBRC 100127 / Av18) TaxID=572546 RepID=D2RDH1_ARCPA|nr:DUF4234 domain-containing protein [Archaeoglobus profundus]ADB58165.1 hypothetical protein Arcpr_1106 [Archaeoglobus profundus DSM 5631]